MYQVLSYLEYEHISVLEWTCSVIRDKLCKNPYYLNSYFWNREKDLMSYNEAKEYINHGPKSVKGFKAMEHARGYLKAKTTWRWNDFGIRARLLIPSCCNKIACCFHWHNRETPGHKWGGAVYLMCAFCYHLHDYAGANS